MVGGWVDAWMDAWMDFHDSLMMEHTDRRASDSLL